MKCVINKATSAYLIAFTFICKFICETREVGALLSRHLNGYLVAICVHAVTIASATIDPFIIAIWAALGKFNAAILSQKVHHPSAVCGRRRIIRDECTFPTWSVQLTAINLRWRGRWCWQVLLHQFCIILNRHSKLVCTEIMAAVPLDAVVKTIRLAHLI